MPNVTIQSLEACWHVCVVRSSSVQLFPRIATEKSSSFPEQCVFRHPFRVLAACGIYIVEEDQLFFPVLFVVKVETLASVNRENLQEHTWLCVNDHEGVCILLF